MAMEPAPAGCWEGVDQEGNAVTQAWFDGLHATLRVDTTLEAETLRTNPFAFLPLEAARSLPPRLEAAPAAALAPCLRRAPDPEPRVPETLARELCRESGGRSMDFLLALNARLFETLEKVVRRAPGIQAPSATLASGRGACRDAAVLFMDCCRCVGVPARFVSGYQADEEAAASGGHDLHAWAEAWLPGAGWLGFDPTHGLLAADRHLSLAASHDPVLAAPLRGSFRGTGVTARLAHRVEVRVSAD